MLFVRQGPFFDQAPGALVGEGFDGLVRQTRPFGVIVQVDTLPLTVRTWPTVEHVAPSDARASAWLGAIGVTAQARRATTATRRPVFIGRTVAKSIRGPTGARRTRDARRSTANAT